MKILTNKQYQDLLNKIEHKDELIQDLMYKNVLAKREITEAKELKNVLEILANKTGIPAPKYDGGMLTYGIATNSSWSTITAINEIREKFKLPDNVLVYEDDILGGKVIKQEVTKCIVIDKEGNVRHDITKQKADKGYSYKLVRE